MQSHPLTALLNKVYQSEIRYCPICCPDKIDHMHTALDIARAELKNQKKKKIITAREVCTDSQYEKVLKQLLNFYGIQFNAQDDIYDLEELYAQLM